MNDEWQAKGGTRFLFLLAMVVTLFVSFLRNSRRDGIGDDDRVGPF